MTERRGGFAPALAVAAAVLLAFAHVLAGRDLAGGDMVACFEPLAHALSDALHRGDVLRTPRLFAGLPLLAHPVAAAAQPQQLLVAVIDPTRALSLLSLAHLALAAAGTSVLLGRLGHAAARAAAGGVFVGLCGVAASAMLQPNLIKSLAWMPLLLAALHRALDPHERARPAVLAGVAILTALLLVSAEPFVLLPAAVAVIGMLAGSLRRWPGRDEPSESRGAPSGAETESGAGRPLRAHPAGRALLALIAGGLAAVPILAAFARYASSSLRSMGWIPEGTSQWSLHPAQALGWIVPLPFGDPLLLGVDGFAAQGLLGGRATEYFLTSYAGALAAGLALCGVVAGGRRERLAALGAAALIVLALGRHGPVQPILDAMGIDWLRYPVKWLLPATIPVAILLAEGIRAVLVPGPVGRRARLVLGGTALLPLAVALLAAPLGRAIAAAAPVLADPDRTGLAREAAWRLACGGAWSLGALLLALALARAAGFAEPSELRRRQAAWGIALLLALDMGLVSRRCVPTFEPSHRSDVPEIARLLRQETSLQRVHVDLEPLLRLGPSPERMPETLAGMASWQREILAFSAPATFGLDAPLPKDVDGLSPLRLQHLAEAVTASGWRERLMLLGAAGVTHVVTLESGLPAQFAETAFRVEGVALEPILIHRNRLALQRARVVPEVRLHHGSQDVLATLRGSRADLFARTTLVAAADWEHAHPDRAPPGEAAAWQGSARIVREDAGSIEVETDGDGGCLVVSDAWLPGMRARVDGLPAPLLRADHAFLGVLVPAGSRRVTIRYCPWLG